MKTCDRRGNLFKKRKKRFPRRSNPEKVSTSVEGEPTWKPFFAFDRRGNLFAKFSGCRAVETPGGEGGGSTLSRPQAIRPTWKPFFFRKGFPVGRFKKVSTSVHLKRFPRRSIRKGFHVGRTPIRPTWKPFRQFRNREKWFLEGHPWKPFRPFDRRGNLLAKSRKRFPRRSNARKGFHGCPSQKVGKRFPRLTFTESTDVETFFGKGFHVGRIKKRFPRRSNKTCDRRGNLFAGLQKGFHVGRIAPIRPTWKPFFRFDRRGNLFCSWLPFDRRGNLFWDSTDVETFLLKSSPEEMISAKRSRARRNIPARRNILHKLNGITSCAITACNMCFLCNNRLQYVLPAQ